MKWWSRLLHGTGTTSRRSHVKLTLAGWSEGQPDRDMRIWRDADSDVLSLTVRGAGIYPFALDEAAQRQWCRDFARKCSAGLIEAQAIHSEFGPSARFIYKRLEIPAYIYTGMLFISFQERCLVWTITAGEHGTTGVREAIVTATLMNAGKLTVEEYRRSWSKDPYEPAYQGVDVSVRRFMSDDESYDDQFPDHPLSKIRRVLAALPSAMQFDPRKPLEC